MGGSKDGDDRHTGSRQLWLAAGRSQWIGRNQKAMTEGGGQMRRRVTSGFIVDSRRRCPRKGGGGIDSTQQET